MSVLEVFGVSAIYENKKPGKYKFIIYINFLYLPSQNKLRITRFWRYFFFWKYDINISKLYFLTCDVFLPDWRCIKISLVFSHGINAMLKTVTNSYLHGFVFVSTRSRVSNSLSFSQSRLGSRSQYSDHGSHTLTGYFDNHALIFKATNVFENMTKEHAIRKTTSIISLYITGS